MDRVCKEERKESEGNGRIRLLYTFVVDRHSKRLAERGDLRPAALVPDHLVHSEEAGREQRNISRPVRTVVLRCHIAHPMS